MKKLKCAVFISDVGFGHMVRQRQVIYELLKSYKNISITVYNKSNLSILKKSFKNKIKYKKNFNNIYLYKTYNGLLDIVKIKKSILNWKGRIKKFLKKKDFELSKYDFFISDLVPEISYFAFQKRKPCFSVCHYTWDWLFKKILRRNKNVELMKEYTNLSTKIYFPPLTHESIIKDARKYQHVNFITNKISKPNKKKKKKKKLKKKKKKKKIFLKFKKLIKI